VPIAKGNIVFTYDGVLTEEDPAGDDDTYVFELHHRGKKYW
jgi:hypothetical protein